MSKMSEIYLSICEMTDQGLDSQTIANKLNIPIEWVLTVISKEQTPIEEYSPYVTINS